MSPNPLNFFNWLGFSSVFSNVKLDIWLDENASKSIVITLDGIITLVSWLFQKAWLSIVVTLDGIFTLVNWLSPNPLNFFNWLGLFDVSSNIKFDIWLLLKPLTVWTLAGIFISVNWLLSNPLIDFNWLGLSSLSSNVKSESKLLLNAPYAIDSTLLGIVKSVNRLPLNA